jgi:hypothetical protein
MSSGEFYDSIRGYGGLSINYLALTEADFTATAGAAYTPPEAGDFRRTNVARTLQLLQDAPGVLETFQTSAADLQLPANTLTYATNDAGDGRIIFLKNSGTGTLTVKDYLGNSLWLVKQSAIVIVVGNNNNNWDFYFTAKNIAFDNSTNGFTAYEVQTAIEEVKTYGQGFPRAGLVLTYNGTISNGNWITYTELLSNPRILYPVNIRIKEWTWNNNNTSLGAFTFEIYKNGQAGGNLIYTYTPTAGERTAGFGYFAFPSNIDFNAGEYMYIRYVKPSGTSISDLGMVLWIARIP